MLLPMTSMRVWWLLSPDTPEKRERIIMYQSPLFGAAEKAGEFAFLGSLLSVGEPEPPEGPAQRIAALSMFVKILSLALMPSMAVMTVLFLMLTTSATSFI